MNKMSDLRREVANRMRDALHGKEIDMVKEIKPRIPHMLGITPLDEVHDPNNEDDSLLDPTHNFWNNYIEDIKTKSAVNEKIRTAIYSLREDGIFEMTYPHGSDADIAYIEVDEMEEESNNIRTTCANCNTEITTEPNLILSGNSYYLNFSLDCDECEFSRVVDRKMTRV